MAEEKLPNVEKLLENLGQMAYGRSRKDSLGDNVCLSCGDPAGEFRDDVSSREYSISGLCQKCQDAFFNGEDE